MNVKQRPDQRYYWRGCAYLRTLVFLISGSARQVSKQFSVGLRKACQGTRHMHQSDASLWVLFILTFFPSFFKLFLRLTFQQNISMQYVLMTCNCIPQYLISGNWIWLLKKNLANICRHGNVAYKSYYGGDSF